MRPTRQLSVTFYKRVMLLMTGVRSFDCMLTLAKAKVLAKHERVHPTNERGTV